MMRADPDHDAVCESQAQHLLVTAPPGTGKTFLTVRLAGELVPLLEPAAQVLLLTFSNQARTQLEREAARQLTPEMRRRVLVTNYHSFFWRAVMAYRRALGLPMRIDVGSRQRRRDALLAGVGATEMKPLEDAPGMIDALAEHRYPEFQDDRTPESGLLDRVLAVVRAEQEAGRFVFDDFGALFWELLERYPTVAAAYATRFPVVIADEHQDASGLQDAIARRLGQSRLVVFADPMQLIHGFRGASESRLDSHRADCDAELTLATAHRWHGNAAVAEWLLAVRARLLGEATTCATPACLDIRETRRDRGFGAVKAEVKYAVGRAFQENHRSVSVLARSNREVGDIRSYLCRQNFRPRQIGSADFEDARLDIEQLPLLQDAQSIATHAIGRIGELIPTIKPASLKQALDRLDSGGVRLTQAGPEARMILEPLSAIYDEGNGRYFESIVQVIEAARLKGHHVPRLEALRALQRTAEALSGGAYNLDEAIQRYSEDVLAAAHAAPRTHQGLFVMTAHQAKGKEFDCVILANANAALFPDDPEGRRLFYVAMTRATHSWTVITPDSGESALLAHLTA